MAKSKSGKDDEDLRGQLREALKLNKALKKRLRQLEKSRHAWEENKLDDENTEGTVPPPQQIKPQPVCPACKRGTLSITDLGIKFLHCCSTCLFRKTELK